MSACTTRPAASHSSSAGTRAEKSWERRRAVARLFGEPDVYPFLAGLPEVIAEDINPPSIRPMKVLSARRGHTAEYDDFVVLRLPSQGNVDNKLNWVVRILCYSVHEAEIVHTQ